MATVLGSNPLTVQFRIALIGDKWTAWLHLVRRLMEITFTNEPDTFLWRSSSSGLFSVKSMYVDFINVGPVSRSKHIWKTKVPLKIKIFMWFVHRAVILTKDNLAKQRWQGSEQCFFCDQEETVQHLFIGCPLATLLWRMIHVAFKLPPPASVANMFGNWLDGVESKTKANIHVGVYVLLWALETVGTTVFLTE